MLSIRWVYLAISVEHRLPTIQQADHITVINNGITEQQGTWIEVSINGFI
ncbi:hypothetical protein EV13_2731 [Prochlorococcus sp. MIT 0702]|nr:hypothetical protein EV12_2680 [Prochlorococcus sp. MIT 0701]KGG25957.1 hypothetical protein EV13_2731 [Prochlorococcus sp. MIT 0702]KGG30866.1 hypothetical protein EV14_2805 [Prochlorococcus sp. MIT 0703]